MARDIFRSRRSLLTSGSALVVGGLAGWTSGNGGSEQRERHGACPTGRAAGGEGTGGTAGTATDTEPTNGTEQGTPAGTAAADTGLAVGDARLVTVETDVGEELVGEATVTNRGSARTDSFVLGLDWLDDAGEYVSTTDVYGVFLASGGTWIPRSPVWLDVETPEAVEDVEASITGTDPWGPLEPYPDGIVLVDHAVRAGSDETVVRGTIRNDREATTFVEAAGHVADADGAVLAMATTIEEMDSGATWRFELSLPTHGRNNRVDSGTVIPYVSVV